MLEELPRRDYSSAATRGSILAVRRFAEYFGKSPEKLGAEDVRRFQVCLLNETRRSSLNKRFSADLKI